MIYALLGSVIGGIVISALLIYPLYFHLPIILIPNWHKASTEVSVLFVLASLLVLVVIGMFAARYSNAQSGWQRVAFGALGGLVSSAIGYGILIGPASGVWGLSRAFPSGLYRAMDNATFITMIKSAISSVGLGAAVTQWGYIGVGVLLGGIGGLLARPGQSVVSFGFFNYVVALSVVGIPVATASYIQAACVFYPLYEQVRKTAFEPLFWIWISVNAPVVSAFVWLLGWQLATWRALERLRTQATICRVSWVLSGVLSVVCPLVQVVAMLSTACIYLPVSLLSLLLGALSGYSVWKMRVLPRKRESLTARSAFVYIVLSGLVVLLTSVFSGFNVLYNYVILVIPLAAPLSPLPAETASVITPVPSVDLAKMINENYLVSV